MSESPAKEAKPLFTDKEERVLKVAWSCLKSGPPDVDTEKLQKAAGFNTLKTTSNTWGAIKKKLLSIAPAEEGEGDEVASPPAKTKSTPKKRTKKDAEADAGNEDDDGEISKKRRKTPSKKALEADTANGEEVDTPRKKRNPPVKKPKIVKAEADEDAADVEEGEIVKTEAKAED